MKSATTKDRLLWKIREHKQGWAFSASDFLAEFSRGELDVALSALVASGDIRRVMRGIYDYPLYSAILEKKIAPDIGQVAQAIARKFNWRIYPDGNTALNYLGLSNQVSVRATYLSDGPSRAYEIASRTLAFRHAAKRELALSPKANLVIQSLRAVSEQQLSSDFLTALASRFSFSEWQEILGEASRSAQWIVSAVKTAARISKGQTHE